jgi:hypothetical protein
MANTHVPVKKDGLTFRIHRDRIMVLHVIGNDLQVFTNDGKWYERKACSLDNFFRKLPADWKDWIESFVKIKSGNCLHESLIEAYNEDEIKYAIVPFQSLHEKAQQILKALTPSDSGIKELKRFEVSLA